MNRRRVILVAGLLVAALSAPAGAATPGKNGLLAYTSGGVVIKTLGTGATTTIVPGSGPEAPRWSPDGRRLLVSLTPEGGAHDDIATINPDGTGLLVVTDSEDGVGPASWSPDGMRIVYSETPPGDVEELWIAKADGSGATQLTFPSTGEYDYYPAWSPDGRTIAFSGTEDDGNGDDIVLIAPDGTHRRDFAATTADEYWPAWSPDGKRIAYQRENDVVVKSLSGGKPILIATDAGAPDWSPDGKWVIYNASRSETGLYKRRADGTGEEILLAAGGSDGSWQPRCTISGNNKANSLTGTAKSELICGKGGNDTIDGKGGLDIVLAGGGNDTVKGGDGNDVLLGEQGDDTFNGGKGKDRCVQGPGSGTKTACES